jgi:hypothetical protein
LIGVAFWNAQAAKDDVDASRLRLVAASNVRIMMSLPLVRPAGCAAPVLS